jgi:integrase
MYTIMVTVTHSLYQSEAKKHKGQKWVKFYIKSPNWDKPKRPTHTEITFWNRADTPEKKTHNNRSKKLVAKLAKEYTDLYKGAEFQEGSQGQITLLAQLEEMINLKKDKSTSAVNGYKNLLKAMKRFCKDKGYNIKMDVNRVNIEFVDKWRLWLTTENVYKSGTSRKYFGLLGTTLKQAKKYGRLYNNPYDGDVEYPKDDDTERVYLTPDEVFAMQNTPTKYDVMKNAFLFMCYTGIRQGDCTKLTWGDLPVNGDGDIIINVRTQKSKTKIFFKIRKGARKFLPERKGDADLIFPIKFDNPVNKNLRYWALEAGIKEKHITAHSARHTFAYFMLSENNTSLYIVSKLLGHKKVSTTEENYGHLSNENVEDAMQKAFGE